MKKVFFTVLSFALLAIAQIVMTTPALAAKTENKTTLVTAQTSQPELPPALDATQITTVTAALPDAGKSDEHSIKLSSAENPNTTGLTANISGKKESENDEGLTKGDDDATGWSYSNYGSAAGWCGIKLDEWNCPLTCPLIDDNCADEPIVQNTNKENFDQANNSAPNTDVGNLTTANKGQTNTATSGTYVEPPKNANISVANLNATNNSGGLVTAFNGGTVNCPTGFTPS